MVRRLDAAVVQGDLQELLEAEVWRLRGWGRSALALQTHTPEDSYWM